MYLKCRSDKSRTTTPQAGVLFYALSLLYVLSTATFVCDIVNFVLSVSNNSICKIIYLFIISCSVACRRTTIASKFNWLVSPWYIPKYSNLLFWFYLPKYLGKYKPLYLSLYSPKSSKIYRCWIVWNQKIRVVIIPIFLAFTYLGQSILSSFDTSKADRFFKLSPHSSYLASGI